MMQKLDGKFHGEIFRNRDGANIPPDRFVCFMAYDDAVPATLAFYQDECERLGAGPEQLAAVQRLRDRVAAWRSAHECLCKIPDAEPEECH